MNREDYGRLTRLETERFASEGYLIVRSLLTGREVGELKQTFMAMHSRGSIPGCFEVATGEEAEREPLKRYPRMLYPHRVDETAKTYMLHPKTVAILEQLLGEEPLAAQSMFYFKPPGARGQALHQDNYYLRVEPHTCIAAWIAIDAADEENGGLVVVPETQDLEIECPHEADSSLSFFKDEVHVPPGKRIVQTTLQPGDALFFNGSTIHGSYPNRSKDRFRRAFICHYVGASTARIGYHISDDLYRRDGTVVRRDKNMDAGPCGEEIQEAH